MKIGLAQIAPTVGDTSGNVKKVKNYFEKASKEKLDLLVFPELTLFGYPPHDLVYRPEIFQKNREALGEVLEFSKGKKTAAFIGLITENPSPLGRAAKNTAVLVQDGKVLFEQHKTLLPTYDVFDESRYFEPAECIESFTFQGKKVVAAICEDLWPEDPEFSRKIYGHRNLEVYKKLKPDLMISLSASPYELKKRERRESIHQKIAKDTGCPLVYVNQSGATDEILFDGGSFVSDENGVSIGAMPFFEESFGVIDLESKKFRFEGEEPKKEEFPNLQKGLVLGIRDYFEKTGFQKALIGLSGGIDSAVVAVLAVQALGKENVHGVAMPSQYSSGHSLDDAEKLAQNLGIRFSVLPIKFLHATAARHFGETRTGAALKQLSDENLQSRLRGLTLMTLSNEENALILCTGNKSELAMGYSTQYGDLIGAMSPIGDLYKTKVYELAHQIQKNSPGLIPENTIEKPPSAELRPDQIDQDSLPPYELLDAVLEEYIEKNKTLKEIKELHEKDFSKKSKMSIEDTIRQLGVMEYKRKQAPFVLRVTRKAFGVGRRVPIAKKLIVP